MANGRDTDAEKLLSRYPCVDRIVPLDNLYEDAANARLHPDNNLAAIKASLREFGQVERLLVQKSSGKLIGGNGRLKAMRELGWMQAEIREFDCDNATAIALSIALNRSAELAQWDDAALAKLLADVSVGDPELEEMFDQLLADVNGSVRAPGKESPPAEPRECFMILIECADEAQQIKLLERFAAEGLACRALMS
jgi:hypothetical protein